MSIHRSLRSSKLGEHRSVLKRHEKIKKLKEQGQYEEGAYYGLPKVRNIKPKIKKKAKEEKKDEGTKTL